MKLDGATVDLDTWPDLPTFLEIEGDSEDAVRAAATRVGLDPGSASYGRVDEVYLAVLARDILTVDTLTFA